MVRAQRWIQRPDLSLILLLSAILSIPLLSCDGGSRSVGPDTEPPADPPEEPDPLPQKAWTFLLYDDADFENAYDPLIDFAGRVAEGENVNFLVLRDGNAAPGAIYAVGRSHGILMKKSYGEINMGAASTLSSALKWAKEYYPAERYILAFYDHGGGWRGSCWDMTNNNDNLTMAEKRSALSDAGGVDLVLFTAPCLMGALEAAYDLRNVTELYVGSEAPSGFIWWREPMRDLSQILESDPGISNVELATFMVNSIWERRTLMEGQSWFESLTMSAVRTDRLEALAGKIDVLSQMYLDQGGAFRDHLAQISPDLTYFSTAMVDLNQLFAALHTVNEDPGSRDAIREIQDALDSALVAERHGDDWPDARGLSLFLPDSVSAGSLQYYTHPGYDLDFVKDTHWDEILLATFPSSTSVATPPEMGSRSGLRPPGGISSGGVGDGLIRSCGVGLPHQAPD